MANITSIKKGQYLKKTDTDSYVHYFFDTDDSVVYLSNKIDGTSETAYAKGTRLHETLNALYTLASEGGQAATNLATLTTKVDNLKAKHTSDISAVNTSIATTKSDLLGTTSDKAGANTIYGANKAAKNAQEKANSAYDLASGLSKAYVFGNASAVYHGRVGGTVDSDGATAGTVIDKNFKVGDSVYVKDTRINDFWISAKRKLTTDNTELPISSIDDIKNATDGAEINVKWTIGREYYYVTLTAVETKANLDGYYDKNYIDNNYLTKGNIEKYYVPYSGATNDINLGEHVLTVTDGALTNPKAAEISKGRFGLCGETIEGDAASWRTVYITVNGIKVGYDATYAYPKGPSGTLATQEFVTGKGYQTETQVDTLIKRTSLTFGGDVIGGGLIGQPIELRLTDMADLPTADTTFSAVKVNKQGLVTAGGQQIVFASTINDSALSNLVIGGVAIVDAQ